MAELTKVFLETEIIKDCFNLLACSNLAEKPEFMKNLLDTVLIRDPLNEKALRQKISFLLYSDRYGEAKSAYKNFTLEYRKVYESEYYRSFTEMIK